MEPTKEKMAVTVVVDKSKVAARLEQLHDEIGVSFTNTDYVGYLIAADLKANAKPVVAYDPLQSLAES